MRRFRGNHVAGAVLLLLAAVAARGLTVHEVQVGGDTISGTTSSQGDVDRVPLRLVEGAVFSISLKVAKGSTLHPSLTVLGPDRQPEAAVMSALVVASKKNAVTLKNSLVGETGRRWLEIRGADGTTGGWILTTKVTLPKKAGATGTTAAGKGEFVFVSPGNATTTISVVASGKSPAVPASPTLLDPNGKAVLADDITSTSKGFTLKGIYLGLAGAWTLKFTTPADGAFVAKAAFKVDKPEKRALSETDVITDPVLVSLTPTSGDMSQVLPITLTVDFAKAGAAVTFRRDLTAVNLTGSQVVLSPGKADVVLTMTPLKKGQYTVDFVNADGGQDSLPDAFTVDSAVAQPATLTPAYGYDTGIVAFTIDGLYFQTGTTAALVRGAETIDGTSVVAISTKIQGNFDLRGHSHGSWNLVVSNPDTAPATVNAVFDLRNAPPTPTSMTPLTDNASTTFTATVNGTEMESPTTVLLRRTGYSDIPGTGVVFVSGSQVKADFDTSAAAPGPWDLVVTNPDAQSGTLAGALWVGGVAGPPVKTVTAGGTLDAPPAVAWNATRGEYAVAWIEVNGSSTDVFVQRMSAAGSAVGSKVSVSPSASSVSKKDAAIGWNSTGDEYLVAWSEPRTFTLASTHPSYNSPTSSLQQVFVQRLRGSDLALQASAVQVTTHTIVSGWNMDEFNNFRTSVAWNPLVGVWQIVWMQEWSTKNISNYGFDDYDVLMRAFTPGTGVLGTTVVIAGSAYHEGDPSIVWDSNGSQMIVAYNGRTTSVSSPLTVFLGAGGPGSSVISASGIDLVDPRIALDTDSKRLLVTWTKMPSGGVRSVEGILVDATSLTTTIGGVVAIGANAAEEHLGASIQYNGLTKEALVAWNRATAAGALSVRVRRASTSGASGLSLLGTESEASGGSGDEASPVGLFASGAGESAVFFLKTMSFTSAGAYTGAVVAGTYRGKELWLQRFR